MPDDSRPLPPGLVILWVSRDPEAARNMAFMYARNSRLKGWWPVVKLVVWGPSAQVLVEDARLKAELGELREAGVELLACKACADRYQAAAGLKALGVEVRYMGEPLSRLLKEGWAVLTV